MKKEKLILAAISLLLISTLCSCCKDNEADRHYTHVAIYYGCGYNNLSDCLVNNVTEELAGGEIPTKDEDKALLAFCHNVAYPYDYTTANPPVLIRIYKNGGHAVLDTVKTYPSNTISASGETLTSVLNEIKEKYKSDSYGFIVSSHSSGWLPVGYKSANDEETVKISKSIGAQYRTSASFSAEMELKEFAAAFPYKMDYIIMDCCLAGCVEVAWELRNACEKIVFSPTEVMSGGYDYNDLALRIFSSPADLRGVCKDHYEKYFSKSSYATTTLVDCSKAEPVATAMEAILDAHRDKFNALVSTPTGSRNVQKYFYDSKYYIYFYDLRDIAVHIEATEAELEALDSALEDFVLYSNHTTRFFNLYLNNVCGVSMYIPYGSWATLNAYYKTLGWNKVVKVLDN